MKTSENIVTLIAGFFCEQCTDSSQPNRDYTGEFMSLLRRLHDRVFPDYRFDQGQLLAQIQAQLRGNSRVVHGYYPPFGTQVILNGHEWVERQAQRQKVAVAERPSPTLIKNNLKHLVKGKLVYYSNVTAATGIPRSTFTRACKFGDLQACFVPELCKYFNVTPEELLSCDLARPAGVPEASQQQSGSEEVAVNGPESSSINTKAEKTVGEVITQQDPAELVRTISRNLGSMLFERNLTAHELSLKTALAGAVCYRFLNEPFVPRGATLNRLAKALALSGCLMSGLGF